MLATNLMDVDAPEDAASTRFLSGELPRNTYADGNQALTISMTIAFRVEAIASSVVFILLKNQRF